MGHPRSGTTNTHKSVASIHSCVWTSQWDLIFPSLLTKYLTYHLRSAFHWIIFKYFIDSDDIKNHKFGIDECQEEQFVLLHFFTGTTFAPGLIKGLHVSRDWLRAIVEEGAGADYQLNYIKKTIARSIYFQGYTDETVYCGNPIQFCAIAPQLRKAFPHAKFIFCCRQPAEAYPSFMELHTIQNPPTRVDPFYIGLRQQFFHDFTVKMYREMARFEGDDNCYWMEFCAWKRDAKYELAKIWTWLDWQFESKNLDIAMKRSESHTNHASSFEIVPAETIKEHTDEFY